MGHGKADLDMDASLWQISNIYIERFKFFVPNTENLEEYIVVKQ